MLAPRDALHGQAQVRRIAEIALVSFGHNCR
jgi:hypothetical protein